MAQSTIMVSGKTKATSTDVVLAAGEVAVIGVFSAADSDVLAKPILVTMKTPGMDNIAGVLTNGTRQLQVSGPGTFRAQRPDLGPSAAYGVFLEK